MQIRGLIIINTFLFFFFSGSNEGLAGLFFFIFECGSDFCIEVTQSVGIQGRLGRTFDSQAAQSVADVCSIVVSWWGIAIGVLPPHSVENCQRQSLWCFLSEYLALNSRTIRIQHPTFSETVLRSWLLHVVVAVVGYRQSKRIGRKKT